MKKNLWQTTKPQDENKQPFGSGELKMLKNISSQMRITLTVWVNWAKNDQKKDISRQMRKAQPTL